MNFAKVFRRHQSKELSSPTQKSNGRTTFVHDFHGYPRPFSYHIPADLQISPSSLTKTSNLVPYRIGLSSDSSLLANGQTNDNDDIVRIPAKSDKGLSPKMRKDRRFQAQLNANKRWLFRSMETLDGWKEKVFPHKNPPTSPSQSRSRSFDNLADKEVHDNKTSVSHNPLRVELQRAISPNRSIEVITNRVINSIGIHRKTANPLPNTARKPALTVQKQSLLSHLTNDHDNTSKAYHDNTSAILDFREISSISFLHSGTRSNDINENTSLTITENTNNSIDTCEKDHDDDNDGAIDANNKKKSEITNNLLVLNNHDDRHRNDNCHGTNDSWDSSTTWIDSLKEQRSPQRKIQFYENLIKLLEQDTLSIDELLVLRKVLAKICPSTGTITTDLDSPVLSMESTTNTLKYLQNASQTNQHSKLSTMTHCTAQRYSSVLPQSPVVYEPLHEQNSGYTTKASSLLIAAKARPCFIQDDQQFVTRQDESSTMEQSYPQHLNPFIDDTDVTPSISTTHESDRNASNDSIRRYFERLTLLETIYEKLNNESNKTSLQTPTHSHEKQQKQSSPQTHSVGQRRIEIEDEIRTPLYTHSSYKIDSNAMMTNKIVEMSVDGSGSVSSGKSSVKRRAPTAPHIRQNNKKHELRTNNPPMFTLSSTDLNLSHNTDQPRNLPTSSKRSHENLPKEINIKEKTPPPLAPLSPSSSSSSPTKTSIVQQATASCDDTGHVFVHDSQSTQLHNVTKDEHPIIPPIKTERIQQWLSSCDANEPLTIQTNLQSPLQRTTPNAQFKTYCTTKSIRQTNCSPEYPTDKNRPKEIKDEFESGRYRTCLQIHLEKTQSTANTNRTPTAFPNKQQASMNGSSNSPHVPYFQRNTLSPTFTHDHQAVFL